MFKKIKGFNIDVGFLPTSYNDFEGHISSVIFFNKCNMSCSYCHNYKLLKGEMKIYSLTSVLEKLLERKNKYNIEHIVLSGGECTCIPEFLDICSYLYSLGFILKIDTNGSNPEVLRTLLSKKYIKFFAMDIKTRLDESSYYSLTGYSNIGNIKKSIELLRDSNVKVLFRTTVFKNIHPLNTILELQKYVFPCKYKIQRGLLTNCCDSKIIEYSFSEFLELKELVF